MGWASLPLCRKRRAAGEKGRENKRRTVHGDFASLFTVPGTSGKFLRLCADG